MQLVLNTQIVRPEADCIAVDIVVQMRKVVVQDQSAPARFRALTVHSLVLLELELLCCFLFPYENSRLSFA